MFDWTGIDEKYKWFAVDKSIGGHVFERKPHVCQGDVWYIAQGHICYVGDFDASDWEDSLQQRPATYNIEQLFKVDKITINGKEFYLVPVEGTK